ncbi:MAG: SDR family oxidoreductase [Ferruginibacter sp.]|nr:SDR family oxidoreductase [Ferruginibacter sp.]
MNVIVTGASKGIGKAIALKFAGEGHQLFLCARNAALLQAAANEIGESCPGAKVNVLPADLSVKEEVFAFANWCAQQAIPDIVVNNAGTYLPGSSMDEPEGHLEMMMNTNLYSAYHLTRKLLPAMIKNRHGHIFNICSIASLDAYSGGGGYSISKYAMNGFSKNLRHELKPLGIKVTAVFPGAVLTDSWGNFDNSNKRIMEASDVASLVYAAAFLSPQAVVDEIKVTPQLGEL